MVTKRFLVLAATLVLLLGLSGVVRAQAKFKLGYVDLQRAIAETEEGRAAKTKLQGIFKKKQDELTKKKEEFEKGKDEYEAKRLLMTPEARAKTEQELQQKLIELQGSLVEHQKDLSKEEAKVMQKILEKMEKILNDIGRTQGFTMILDKSEGRILFAEPSLDLTNEVIRRYNDLK
ncbi:MAG: OmpH family outer membrane protein [Deltaproteobacteria bacterium]|nr:OmpH family outer membrane protein [Deltaproteobacteria bacterium]